MNKHCNKALSILLVLVLLLQIFSGSVFAEPEEPDPAGDSGESQSGTAEPEAGAQALAPEESNSAHVLYELESLRQADEKHFRMSDGSFLAVSYGAAVHYEDGNGNWKDIDNTLAQGDSKLNGIPENVYYSENGSEIRQFSANPEETGYLFSAKSGAYGISFYADFSENEPKEAGTQSAAKIHYLAQEVSGAIESAPLEEQVAPQKLTAEIEYDGVWENTRLTYEASGFDVKESIIVTAPRENYAFRFRMVSEGLDARLDEDGSVLLSHGDAEVFCIPAPYLLDAGGACSEEASYLLSEDDGAYMLTVHADPKWMNDPSRVFPVTIDPTVICTTSSSTPNIITGFVNNGSKVPGTTTKKQFVRSGYYTNTGYDPDCTGNTVGLVYVKNLPTVPAGCVVTDTFLALKQAAYGGTAHDNYFKIYGTTISTPSSPESYINNMTWASFTSSILPNYIKLYSSSTENATLDYMHEWFQTGRTDYYDISGVAQKWYMNSSDVSRLLVLDDGHNSTVNARVSYGGYCYSYDVYRPKLYVSYRNVVGLEGIYSYHTQSIGRAGSAYINDFTLGLTVSVPITSSPSGTLPLGVSLIYNAALCYAQFTDTGDIHTANYSNAKAGYGWKTSVQQTITQEPIQIGETTENLLVYTDSDGTEHYFYPQSGSSTVYEDEDGLGLTITVSGSSYTMEDKEKNKWYFTYGYLTQYTDNNSNSLFYAYDGVAYSSGSTSWKPSNNSSAHRVTTIARKNNGGTLENPIATLVYDGSGNTGYLTSIKDKANRVTTLSYSGGKLTTITFPDGKTASYTYSAWTDSANTTYYRLSQASDNELGFRIAYTYGSVRKLQAYTVTEQAKKDNNQWITGQKLRCYQQGAVYSRFRYFGASEDLTGNGHLVTLHYFDNYGRTINTITMNAAETDILGVSEGKYEQNEGTSKKNNRLANAASCGMNEPSFVLNGNLEHATDLYQWDSYGDASGGARANSGTTPSVTPHSGNYLMKLYLGSSANAETCSQRVYLEGGSTYVFSGYVNTSCTTSFASNGAVYLAIRDANGYSNLAISTKVTHASSASIANGWERLEAVYTPDTSGTYRVVAAIEHVSKVVVFDDFQLERVPELRSAALLNANPLRVKNEVGASAYNLLQLGSFDSPYIYSGSSISTYASAWWSYTTSIAVPSSEQHHLGGYSMKIAPSLTAKRRASQTVSVQASSDKSYILSGWGKTATTRTENGSSMTGDNDEQRRFFGMIAKVCYTDGTMPDYHYVSFNDDVDQWQFASGCIVPKQANKTVSTITVSLALDYCPNSAYFDDVTLVQEPVQTYDYDSDGNLVSATNSEGQTSTEYDEDDRLKKYTTMSGVQYALTYSGTSRNPLTITSDSVRNTYSYDAAGNLQQTITRQSNNNGIYLQTNATYDSTKNYPASATDSSGTTTYTTYDSSKGLLTGSTNAHNVETHYSYYPNNDRSKGCYQTNIAALTYAYYEDAVAHGADHGRLLQINRKGKNYTNTTQPDFWQAYSFVYDTWGNVTDVKVRRAVSDTDDDVTGSYDTLVLNDYDSDSRLTKMTYPSDEYVEYDYDLFDRCIHEVYNNAGGSVQAEHFYVYSADGQLARQYAKVGGAITESYSFEYDSLGRLIHSSEEKGTEIVQRTEHKYDTANRLKAQNWLIGKSGFSESYEYNDAPNPPDPNYTGLKDGSLKSLEITSTLPSGISSCDKLVYHYDSLKRLSSTETKDSSDAVINTRNYTYHTLYGTRTSNRLAQFVYRKPSNNAIISGNAYTYDANGNITKIDEVFTVSNTDTTRTLAEYEYDALDQLTKETRYTYSGNSTTPSGSTVVNYSVDTAGNIREIDRGANIFSLSYEDDDWADKLTAVSDGVSNVTINYASGGNPSNWYNGNIYSNLTWTQGRRLSSVQHGLETDSYAYDMNGIRTSKIADGKKHEYVTQNGKLVRETVTDVSTGAFYYTLDFTYDESGHPLTMRRYNDADLTHNYITLHYICNLQGDVVKLVYGTSNTVYASYTYDAWGNVLSAVENGSYDYAAINPLRYRGYYYDSETGWYYLQSRYYDPALGRFINADGYASTGQGFLGYNMFAYCENNPIIFCDKSGHALNASLMLTDSGVNPQRLLIEELEEQTGYKLFSTQDDAAAEVAEVLWYRSKNNNVEYCSMVYQIDLSLYGGYGYAYYTDSVLRGMHDNVFLQLLELESYADKMIGREVAFVHSHPHCTCHISNEFSHGDKGVPYLVSVDSVYLIGQNHELQRWDRDGTEKEEFFAQAIKSLQIVLRLFGGD